MRNTLVVATILALGTGYIACSSSPSAPSFESGDDGGGSGSGSSSSGGSSGSGSGSSSGGSSSSGSSSGGGSGGGSGSGSGSSSGGSSGCTTNTGPISGTVGATGGSISRLVFGVVGDTRPANEDDPSGYPTAIITKIFGDIEAQSPRPPLVIATGDYQFSNAKSGTGAQQVDTYMQARATYSGAFFPAMGNHECGVCGSFSTSDNAICGPSDTDCGPTVNYNAFMGSMLQPISKTLPYYSINVNATDNSWTAKFVVTAANAWDTPQQTWLTSTLAQKTTYTFVIRHQTSDATPPLPTGVGGVDAVLANYPYTLLIAGHAHTYGHYSSSPQSVTFGNGGAPLSNSSHDYGYGIFAQRCDGAIVVDDYDYMTNATDSYFHFVITPDGKITQ